MTIKFQYKIAFFVLLSGLQTAYSQKKDENIGTEVVNVVKPYTPTVSDAFKVRETPVLDDEETLKKEEINYNIFSFPVASTFMPSKGKAAAVDKTEQERLFKNYLTLGIGNYANANAELFITENIDDNSYVGGMLRHFSSQGGIKGLMLDDKFMDTSLDLTYGYKQQSFSWTADMGYQHQVYNWYGVNTEYFGAPDPALYNGVDPQHTFHNFYLGSRLTFNDSFFKEASIKYNRFWDAAGSGENRFYVKPSFDFEFNDTKIKTSFIVDYIGGNFKQDYFGFDKINYGFANIGVSPSYIINRDAWTINLGAAAYYSSDLENSESKFFIYPQISASLKVVGDLMIFYTGIDGSLQQNSYRDFTNENPFLSPTLGIAPTDRQYDIFAGLKGKLASNVSYTIRGSYTSEKGKALFVRNPYPVAGSFTNLSDLEGYQLGNSFMIAYDDVKTIGFFGEIKADFSKNVTFGINGSFNSYSTDKLPEAWNLPSFKTGMNLHVNITDKIYAGTDLFYVGQREDVNYIATTTMTIDGYFDANANVGYRYNDRFTAFLRLNNIANQAYQKWSFYPVQQFQVLVGANYKFDF